MTIDASLLASHVNGHAATSSWSSHHPRRPHAWWLEGARAAQRQARIDQRQREQDQAEEQTRRLEERWHRLCRRYDSKHSRGGG